MSLLTDLIDYVAQYEISELSKYDAAATALLNSINFQDVMISAAQNGRKYTMFPLTITSINGQFSNIKDIKNIEDALLIKLRSAYPEITFYKDKYKELNIYAQWELNGKTQDGPIV